MNCQYTTNRMSSFQHLPIPKVIAVTGGKGGVGKTQVAINLAATLAQRQQRVVLMDADMGLANIDVLLGLRGSRNLAHVLEGQCELQDILIPGPFGMSVIPASQGVKKMASLSSSELAGLIQRFQTLSCDMDHLIIDTAAGISEMVVGLVGASHEILVVVCNDPASLTDAYALIKVLHTLHGVHKFKIVINMTQSFEESREVFAKLTKVADQFLNVSLNWIGTIPQDSSVVKAMRKQKPVVELYPESKISEAFNKLATRIMMFPKHVPLSGQMQFFSESMWAKTDFV